MESTARPFLEALHAWEAFYLMAGTAAVTLTGLLFVALSMHVAILFREKHARTRELAFQAFQGYLYVLVTALLFLAPPLSHRILGATYALMNLVLVVRTAWRMRKLPRKGGGIPKKSDRTWGLALPAFGYGSGLALGVLIAFEGIPRGNGLMIPPLIVLASATRMAWALLENVAWIEAARSGDETRAELVRRSEVE
jgi:hypothetical protein